MKIAKPVLVMLKRIWYSAGRRFGLQRHWTSVPTHPRTTVSASPSSVIPMKTNKKPTDIVPGMPGRFTLSPAASADTSR